MCVIITTPDRKHRPTLETLRLCAKQNRDGSGMAWLEGSRVRFFKGLSPDAISEHLAILTGPVVIHFRYATVGGKCGSLCHPFPITADAAPKEYGSSKAVLFHNGHWGEYEKFSRSNGIDLRGPVSDTRVAAVGTFLGGREFIRTLPGRYVIFSAAGIERF